MAARENKRGECDAWWSSSSRAERMSSTVSDSPSMLLFCSSFGLHAGSLIVSRKPQSNSQSHENTIADWAVIDRTVLKG